MIEGAQRLAALCLRGDVAVDDLQQRFMRRVGGLRRERGACQARVEPDDTLVAQAVDAVVVPMFLR